MRYTPIIGLSALILSACSPATTTVPTVVPLPTVTTPTVAPTAAPTTAPTAAATAAPTSAPTAAPTSAPTAAPTATPEPTGVVQADTAGLSRELPPAPSAAPAAASEAVGVPVRIVIGDVALDLPIVSVGLDANRIPIVPDHDVGWYNTSARTTTGDNVVLWGHVLRFRETPDIPAPFARLEQLKVGAPVTLYDGAGNAYPYVLTRQVRARPNEVQYILPQGKAMVTMVSCIGDKVIQDGTVVNTTERLISIAEPAR